MKKITLFWCISFIKPIQSGLPQGCSRIFGGSKKSPPFLKSVTHILQWWKLAQLYNTYRKSKNFMNHMTHPLISAGINIFLEKIRKFCYIKKYRYRFHLDRYFLTLLTSIETLRIVLIIMVTILMMSAKWLPQTFLK